jgi:hypothetical protein
MKTEMFVNAVFCDKDGAVESVACRLRGVKDAKSFKIPAAAFGDHLPEKNDGLFVDITGKLSESGNYISAPDAKILQIVPGAGTPTSIERDADDYLKALMATDTTF